MPENIQNLTLPDNSPVAHTYAEVSSRLHEIVKSNNGKPPSPEQVKFMLKQLEGLDSFDDEAPFVGAVEMDDARDIMGEENFYGTEAIRKVFGFDVPVDQIPTINFSEKELMKAKKQGLSLILRWDITPDRKWLDINKLCLVWISRFKVGTGANINDMVDYVRSSGVNEAVRLGWALCGPYGQYIDTVDKTNYPDLMDWFRDQFSKYVPAREVKASFEDTKEYFKTPGFLWQSNFLNVPVIQDFLPTLNEVVYDAVLLGDKMKLGTILTRTSRREGPSGTQKAACLYLRENRTLGHYEKILSVFEKTDMLTCDSHNIKLVVNRY